MSENSPEEENVFEIVINSSEESIDETGYIGQVNDDSENDKYSENEEDIPFMKEKEEEEEEKHELNLDSIPTTKKVKIMKIAKITAADKIIKKAKEGNKKITKPTIVDKKKKMSIAEKLAERNKKYTVVKTKASTQNINKDLQSLFDICSVTSNLSGKPIKQQDSVVNKIAFVQKKGDRRLNKLRSVSTKDKARIQSNLGNDRINAAKSVILQQNL